MGKKNTSARHAGGHMTAKQQDKLLAKQDTANNAKPSGPPKKPTTWDYGTKYKKKK